MLTYIHSLCIHGIDGPRLTVELSPLSTCMPIIALSHRYMYDRFSMCRLQSVHIHCFVLNSNLRFSQHIALYGKSQFDAFQMMAIITRSVEVCLYLCRAYTCGS